MCYLNPDAIIPFEGFTITFCSFNKEITFVKQGIYVIKCVKSEVIGYRLQNSLVLIFYIMI